jgi:hypothetical protein
MEYEEQIVWQPIYLNQREGTNFRIILDRSFAKDCLEKKLTSKQQMAFNEVASKQVTGEKIRIPFLFYNDTILLKQINLDSDRWFYIPERYGRNPLDSLSNKSVIYQSNNFDTSWDRNITLSLFDFWVMHINSFDEK